MSSYTTGFVGDGEQMLVDEQSDFEQSTLHGSVHRPPLPDMSNTTGLVDHMLDDKGSFDRMEGVMQTARAYQQEMVDESLRQNTIIAVSYRNAYYQ
jgi:hypothetical protein